MIIFSYSPLFSDWEDTISSNWLDGSLPNSRRNCLVLDGEGGDGEGDDSWEARRWLAASSSTDVGGDVSSSGAGPLLGAGNGSPLGEAALDSSEFEFLR